MFNCIQAGLISDPFAPSNVPCVRIARVYVVIDGRSPLFADAVDLLIAISVCVWKCQTARSFERLRRGSKSKRRLKATLRAAIALVIDVFCAREKNRGRSRARYFKLI